MNPLVASTNKTGTQLFVRLMKIMHALPKIDQTYQILIFGIEQDF